MFANKHVVVALLVAPVLSILAWFAVGSLTGEQAALAEAGKTYPLVEKSNCRYPSGVCDLENQDIKLALTLDLTEGLALVLTASHPLETALMAIARPDQGLGPRAMRVRDEGGFEWRLPLTALPQPDERIRVAITVAKSAYFADASTRFLHPKD